MVERLLASPHYGEHWGRHWLDVVRYADTAGENSDHPLPHAWRYRNWVIQAFNDDQPYDEFLREQIAGDLLATGRSAGASRGPHRRHRLPGDRAPVRPRHRPGHAPDLRRHDRHAGQVGARTDARLLPLPRPQVRSADVRDYYGLYGIFASTKFAFPGCEPKQQPRDLVPLTPTAESLQLAKQIDEQVAALDADLKRVAEEQTAAAKKLSEAAAQRCRFSRRGRSTTANRPNWTAVARQPLDQRPVKRGEVIQLSIAPRGNHGADSTLVELEIAEVGWPARRWSVADLVPDLLGRATRTPDTYGNADVWCFLDLHDGPRLLPESLREINGRRELQAWRNGDTPSVFVNSSDQPVKVWTELPPRRSSCIPVRRGPVAVRGSVRSTVWSRSADASPMPIRAGPMASAGGWNNLRRRKSAAALVGLGQYRAATDGSHAPSGAN